MRLLRVRADEFNSAIKICCFTFPRIDAEIWQQIQKWMRNISENSLLISLKTNIWKKMTLFTQEVSDFAYREIEKELPHVMPQGITEWHVSANDTPANMRVPLYSVFHCSHIPTAYRINSRSLTTSLRLMIFRSVHATWTGLSTEEPRLDRHIVNA